VLARAISTVPAGICDSRKWDVPFRLGHRTHLILSVIVIGLIHFDRRAKRVSPRACNTRELSQTLRGDSFRPVRIYKLSQVVHGIPLLHRLNHLDRLPALMADENENRIEVWKLIDVFAGRTLNLEHA
jgi:hypothetical protein